MLVVESSVPPTGIVERLRLAALASYGIMDTSPEPEFDAFVARAAARFSAPISLISLIDSERQWFKARIGIDARHTSRDIAFCAHTIETGQPLIVNDARKDQRFAANPLVTGAPHIRFYAGAPLVTPLGRVLGTINVIDVKPRLQWASADTADLVALAGEVMGLLEARRSALVRQRALGADEAPASLAKH